MTGADMQNDPRLVWEVEAELGEAPATGVTPVTAVVAAGGESDLLAGELDIHEDEHGHETSSVWSTRSIVTTAGLGAGAWREGTRFEVFSCQVFSEGDADMSPGPETPGSEE